MQFLQLHHSMANVKIYKRRFYIFDFRQGMTDMNDSNRQTCTPTDSEMDKPMAIGEIVQIFPKNLGK